MMCPRRADWIFRLGSSSKGTMARAVLLLHSRMRRHLAGGLVALVVASATALSSSSVAWAADADTERARALFEEAGELERHGQWTAAQDKLRAALRLRETPQLYYALGWALENDDKLLEAKAEYETAARLSRDKNVEEVTRLAAARLADLDSKMPVIKVRVSGAGRSATKVIVDGREVRRGSDDVATTLVNPGSHVIRVERAEGSVEQIAYVGRSTVRTIDVDAGEAVATRDTPPERHGKAKNATVLPRSSGDHNGGADSSVVVPWLLLSGGLAFMAGGGALLVSASSDADTRDSMRAKWCTATACTGTTATRPETAEAAAFRREASDAASTGNTKQAVGLVVGGTGIVAATVGVILLLRNDSKSSTTEKRVTTRASTAAIQPLPGGAFATTSFTF
jgi:hypothetical protein